MPALPFLSFPTQVALRRFTVAAALGAALTPLAAQTPAHAPHEKLDYTAFGVPLPKDPANAQISEALRQVSAQRIHENIAKLVSFHNRSTISSTDTDLPAGTGVLAAADWIKSQFESYSKACGDCLEVKVDTFVEEPAHANTGFGQRIVKPTPIRNVYAILRGTDPTASKRMYLVTGHYDSRETNIMETHSFAPGANDDASGTAVSLEAARVLSQHRFPATIVFVAVAGEEQGLNGSRHLAQLAKSEGWELEGVLNNDIVGGDTTPGDTLQSKSRIRVFSQGIPPSAPLEEIRRMLALGMDNDTPSRELAREVLAVGRTYFPAPGTAESSRALKPFEPVMELRLDRFLRGGDHMSFSAEGFPAVRFTEWRENFNHQHQHVRVENGVQYGDLIQFDDFNYIAQAARLNIATLATLASSPGMPQNVRVLTTNLDNNTTLTWDAPASPAGPVHYQVVWRPTAENDWRYATPLSGQGVPFDNNSITMPVSKDNVFFGVRACNAANQCSQAVAPVPQRR